MAKNNRQDTNKATGKTQAKKAVPADATPGKPKARTLRPKPPPAQPVQESETAPILAEATSQNTPTQPAMEVHHHPEIAHGKKSWKEYLLEGLMIFIAVTLGFIAENIRESITNHEHVKELTSQLVQGLKSDTALLNEIYQEETRISKANNDLFNLLQQPLKKEDMGRLLQLVVASHSMQPFHPSTGAIEAVKKELHLKQFSNSKIISYISEYEKHIELLRTVQDITLQYQRSFIDPFLLKHFSALSLDTAFNNPPMANPAIQNLSQPDITQLNVDLVLIRINTRELLKDNLKVKADAVKLLQYVKEEYDPAEE